MVSDSWILWIFLDNDPEENLTSEATMIYGISLLPNHVIRWPPKIGWRWMARGSLSIIKKDMTLKNMGCLGPIFGHFPQISRVFTTPAPCRRHLTWHEAAPLRRPWQGHAVGSHLVGGPADGEERCSAGDVSMFYD